HLNGTQHSDMEHWSHLVPPNYARHRHCHRLREPLKRQTGTLIGSEPCKSVSEAHDSTSCLPPVSSSSVSKSFALPLIVSARAPPIPSTSVSVFWPAVATSSTDSKPASRSTSARSLPTSRMSVRAGWSVSSPSVSSSPLS